MKAIGIMRYGGPEVLEVIDVEEVNVGFEEIRIKNFASAVNPTDIVSRSGMIAKFRKDDPVFPSVPGMDVAGIVDQIGEAVTADIKIGDRVMGMVIPDGNYGAYREQLILNQSAVVLAPKNSSHEEASTLPMNSLTARLSLDLLNLKSGQVIAVTGGPGAYGGYVIQLAKADGLIVIADSSDSDESLLKDLGADIIISREKSFVDQIGDDVKSDIAIGDRVMGMVIPDGDYGAYREQLVLNQDAVVLAPKNTSHEEACTLPMNSLTARLSLDLLNLSPGQVIAVTGGPGAYGGYAIQLAKADGLNVLADSNQSDKTLLKELGVDIIISRQKNFVDQVRDYFPDGVDGIADGALLNEKAIDAVRDGGSFTSIRGFKGSPQRNINFSTTWVTAYNCDKKILDKIRQQVNAGLITPRVADVVDPENAAEAHKRLEEGGTRGRMVIKWS